ncbi:SEC-C metal-binding domain-containing protein [Pseudomonas aeruginosa]|uniref:SEC-C metal-binding domain-containing protein n=1 Tax=Pseudomonas aeruginosa TaxID=287 RepID=UPI002E20443F|nr:SEC-C metal-binding domain-containing protein [Pseudomonas aeruginosa]MED5024805.1 SEC-C metal-binding domain-containing protein [Pseudomonas aeruginosa]
MNNELPRSEHQLFSELASLCLSPGYAHTIAYFCFRDNLIQYSDEVPPDDMSCMSSGECLSRAEISTLIGLMIKGPIDYTIPAPPVMQDYIIRTDQLLAELHKVMSFEPFRGQDWKRIVDEGHSPLQDGIAFREPIFHGGESAYYFQYLDLAGRKYKADNAWLTANKGFSIEAAQSVVRVARELQCEKLSTQLAAMQQLPPSEWSTLPAHLLTSAEIVKRSGIAQHIVTRVLDAFALPTSEINENFTALSEFNISNALPLLRLNQSEFLLFQPYSLAEALYESPFYWMSSDKAYRATAMNNRGRFAEGFATDRLNGVFGSLHVHTNVDIYETKGNRLGEVDVLVIYADRAIVLQAKSKRLTLEARKGNDQALKDDFKKSVQDSYDQGHLCASMLSDMRFKFVDPTGTELEFDRGFKEIYILCLVSDHYPALSFQARQFLQYRETDIIKPPLVLDVFALDAMTEMLKTPLYLLSYLHRRTLYADRLSALQELTILSYHLKQNLWFEGTPGKFVIAEGHSADLDIAMSARREGAPGKTTPEGILTYFSDTALGRLIEDIEARADPRMIDLGFLLLMLNGETMADTNSGIELAVSRARCDGQPHDITVCLGDTGLTIHCSDWSTAESAAALKNHCERRKNMEKADSWFGICLGSRDARMRFGICLDYAWRQAPTFMSKPIANTKTVSGSQPEDRKVGRNDSCPCGSGIKYKKCCLE